MRSCLFLCLLASALVLAQADPQAAAPAAAASVDLSPIQRSVAALESTLSSISASTNDLKSAGSQTATSVNSLTSTVQDGLKKLQEDIQSRISAVEREVAEVKKVVNAVAAAQTASASAKPSTSNSDATLAQVLANQKVIMAQLANVTASWSFDHEALLESTKAHSLTFYNFAQRWANEASAQYPHVIANVKDLSQVGVVQAKEMLAHSQKLTQEGRVHLTDVLQANGVPAEHAGTAAIAILVVVGLILTFSAWTIVSLFFSIICCRSAKKKVSTKAAAKKNN